MVPDLNILVGKWSKIGKKKMADFALQKQVETTLANLWLKGVSLILAYF